MRSESIGHGAQTTGLYCLADNIAGVVREGVVEVGVWGVEGEEVCVCVFPTSESRAPSHIDFGCSRHMPSIMYE